MNSGRSQQILLIAAFLIVIYGVGLSQALVEIRQGERPQIADLFLQKPTQSNLRAFEKELENTGWFVQASRPWMRSMFYFTLGDLGDKAILGKDGWLYYKPGARYLIEPLSQRVDQATTDVSQVVAAVVSFRDQLLKRGIQLLVLPAPGKASLYPQMLTRRAEDLGRPFPTHTREVIAELGKAGVAVVDLFQTYTQAQAEPTEEFPTPFYLAQDTHWSPSGMRLAAHTVAQEILHRGWIEPGEGKFERRPVALARHGDLLEMVDLPPLTRSFAPEDLRCGQIVDRKTGELYASSPDSDILVLGDSFLRIYESDEPGSAGFTAHLAYELQQPLTSVISDGGASTLVRQRLKRTPALLQGKKIVVWEFVERDIRFGTQGWQDVPLPKVLTSSSADDK